MSSTLDAGTEQHSLWFDNSSLGFTEKIWEIFKTDLWRWNCPLPQTFGGESKPRERKIWPYMLFSCRSWLTTLRLTLMILYLLDNFEFSEEAKQIFRFINLRIMQWYSLFIFLHTYRLLCNHFCLDMSQMWILMFLVK